MSDDERDEVPEGMIETLEHLAYGLWSIFYTPIELPEEKKEDEPYRPEPLAPPNPNLPMYTQTASPGNIRRPNPELSGDQE